MAGGTTAAPVAAETLAPEAMGPLGAGMPPAMGLSSAEGVPQMATTKASMPEEVLNQLAASADPAPILRKLSMFDGESQTDVQKGAAPLTSVQNDALKKMMAPPAPPKFLPGEKVAAPRGKINLTGYSKIIQG